MNGPPFRAEHIGSLLRPSALTSAFRAWSAGEIDGTRFEAVQEECIRAAVALQEGVGLQVVTDGEFRRASYWGHFLGPVAGLGTAEAVYRFRDDTGEEVSFLAPQVEDRVRRLTRTEDTDRQNRSRIQGWLLHCLHVSTTLPAS